MMQATTGTNRAARREAEQGAAAGRVAERVAERNAAGRGTKGWDARPAGRKRTTIMRAGCCSLALLTGSLLVGSLLNDTAFGGAFYTTLVFLLPGGLVAALTAAGMAAERPSVRKLGFYLSHGGVLLIACGALLSWTLGQNTTFNIPVDPGATYGQVQISEEENVEFGFDISVQDFQLEYRGGQVAQYHAQLRIGDGSKSEMRAMKVNSPITYGGWKFYLMDYDRSNESYVSLHAKKDPGGRLFAAGLWSVIVGTAMLCLRIGIGRSVIS